MKRIILIVLRVIFRLPKWWFYDLKKYQNREKYPTIDEGYKFASFLAETVREKGRIELECTGLENLPKEGSYFVTPNHQGMFDIVALFCTHEKPMKFVLKKELTKTILIKDICKTLDFYPLDRENIREGAKMVMNVTKEVKNGMTYCIFPEGTRSRNGNHLLEFKGGTFKIAERSHCPIVPVCMIDSYQVFESNNIKKVKAQIHYLPAIYYEEYKDLKTVEIAALVQSRIEACMKEHGAI